MSTVNASTGFTPFHLRLGRSPRVIPPITSEAGDAAVVDFGPTDTENALDLLRRMETDVMEAQDTLLLAKANQALHANVSRGADHRFSVGDRVLLSTFHRRREYMQRGSNRVAK
ncbi:uncharacterized protein TRAVEDRAFT_86614, partial [Trametes versicolor FP-101664 SS1]|uniref:uncharacterized protein n=1 Tax=Trametes versicolor (strain FP-101664) TaxID=717944 RepID=UPI00046243BD